MRPKLLPATAVLLGTLFAMSASAHLEGQTFEHMVGEDMIEIGIDAVDILPGVPAALSFALIEHPKQPGWSYVPSDDVHITVKNDAGATVYERTLPTKTSPQFLSYSFPGNGIYDIGVRYERDGQSIAETDLTLVASKSLNIDVLDWLVVLALGAGAYGGTLYGLMKKRA